MPGASTGYLSARRTVEVERAPADRFETELAQDRRRHRTTPDHQTRDAGFARDRETCRHHRAVDPTAAELRPHGAAVDDRRGRREQGHARAGGGLAVDHREEDAPVACLELMQAPPLLGARL